MTQSHEKSPRRHAARVASATVLAGFLAVGTVVSFLPVGEAQAQKQAQPKLSAAVAKKLRPAQEALQKSEWDTSIQLATEALAEAKEPYDREISLRILMGAAAGKKDLLQYAQYAEQLLPFDTLPADERQRTLKQLAQIYFQNKDYPKSQQWAKQWAEATSASDAYELLAATHLIQRDCQGGIGPLEKSVEGKQPTESQLRQLNFCYYDLGDKPKRQSTMEALTTRFPKREYYIDLVNLYQEQEIDSRAVLHLYRLGLDRDWLSRESEFVEFAGLAVDAGSPAEAQKALATARQKGALASGQRNDQLMKQATQLADEDRKTIAALDKEARAGKNGEADVKVGLAYLGLGDNAKAVEAIKRGLQPDRIARVRRVDDAWMTLGVALARLGNDAEAGQAFQQAKPDQRMTRAAELWIAIGDPNTGEPAAEPAVDQEPPAGG